jgi:hypothetical protein
LVTRPHDPFGEVRRRILYLVPWQVTMQTTRRAHPLG